MDSKTPPDRKSVNTGSAKHPTDSPEKVRPNPRQKGYPRKRKPLPDDQIEKDRILARKLHSVVYAFPFLVLLGVGLWLWLRD